MAVSVGLLLTLELTAAASLLISMQLSVGFGLLACALWLVALAAGAEERAWASGRGALVGQQAAASSGAGAGARAGAGFLAAGRQHGHHGAPGRLGDPLGHTGSQSVHLIPLGVLGSSCGQHRAAGAGAAVGASAAAAGGQAATVGGCCAAAAAARARRGSTAADRAAGAAARQLREAAVLHRCCSIEQWW